MDAQDAICMQTLNNEPDDGNFDYRRAHTIDRIRDLVTSFAVLDESTKDKTMCRTFVSIKLKIIIYRKKF